MFDVNVRYEMKNILMMVGMCLTILFGYNMTNPVAEANTLAVSGTFMYLVNRISK